MDCPSCSDTFNTERSMKIHHKLKHNKSLAVESAECVNCSTQFQYYPSSKSGKICPECTVEGDQWVKSMSAITDNYPMGEANDKGKDGPKIQKKRIQQIKKNCVCNRCGYENSRALQFHHVDDKNGNIPRIVSESNDWQTLLEELDKCEIICANCHQIEHKNW